MSKQFLFSPTVWRGFAIALLLFPTSGHCDWSTSVADLFGSKGKNMKEVATKIATLSEENEIWGLDFSPDGKHLAATPFDSATVHLWDWQGNRLERTLGRAQGSVTVSEPIRFSPDGKLLAICHTRDGVSHIVARIWNTDTWDVVHDIKEPVGGGCNAIGFTSDGKSLIRVLARSIGTSGGSLIQYDITSWKTILELSTQPFLPSTLAVSPDNNFVAIGGQAYNGGKGLAVTIQGQIAIVDMVQRKITNTLTTKNGERGALAWSPDGVHLAFEGKNGVEIFDVRTKERVVEEIKESDRSNVHVRYTPDGKYFIESDFGQGGTEVRIWDGQHQQLLQVIKAIPGCIAVSRDSRYMAMGGNKKIIVWQLK